MTEQPARQPDSRPTVSLLPKISTSSRQLSVALCATESSRHLPTIWFQAPNFLPACCAVLSCPAEPLLVATRKLVPPFNGLDVSPIVWVALLSFLSEILTGPQGILSLIARKGI